MPRIDANGTKWVAKEEALDIVKNGGMITSSTIGADYSHNTVVDATGQYRGRMRWSTFEAVINACGGRKAFTATKRGIGTNYGYILKAFAKV